MASVLIFVVDRSNFWNNITIQLNYKQHILDSSKTSSIMNWDKFADVIKILSRSFDLNCNLYMADTTATIVVSCMVILQRSMWPFVSNCGIEINDSEDFSFSILCN